MKTFTRTLRLVLALGLCLTLAAPAAEALAQDSSSKSQSQSQAKPKSKSKDSKDSKDSKKSKKSGKSEGKSSKSKDAEKPAKKKAPSGEGFRGLPWGSPLSVLKEPELREESGNLRYYTVPDENMNVQGVVVREIVYVFCKDKLAGVLTRYDGQVNHLTLLGRLTDLHGAPLESPENLQGDRSWRFDAGDVSIMMEYSAKGSTGALVWFAKEQVAACQQAAAQ